MQTVLQIPISRLQKDSQKSLLELICYFVVIFMLYSTHVALPASIQFIFSYILAASPLVTYGLSFLPAFHKHTIQVHVLSGFFMLFFGVIQFFPKLRHKYRKLHRISGRIYIVAGLINMLTLVYYFPAMGSGKFYNEPNFNLQIAVAIAMVLWTIETCIAFYMIFFKRNYQSHSQWMFRSYFLTCSPLTQRLWTLILNLLLRCIVFLPSLDDEMYERFNRPLLALAAWGGLMCNVLIPEILISFGYFNKAKQDTTSSDTTASVL